jgi:hypothetical protein
VLSHTRASPSFHTYPLPPHALTQGDRWKQERAGTYLSSPRESSHRTEHRRGPVHKQSLVRVMEQLWSRGGMSTRTFASSKFEFQPLEINFDRSKLHAFRTPPHPHSYTVHCRSPLPPWPAPLCSTLPLRLRYHSPQRSPLRPPPHVPLRPPSRSQRPPLPCAARALHRRSRSRRAHRA